MPAHWQAGDPCPGCGCDAFTESPVGTLHAHLADCPMLDVNALREQLQGAVEALETIRDKFGGVCDDYENCAHVACQDSYSAWTVADRYLRGGQS